MNPFLRDPSAHRRTPLRAEVPNAKPSDGGGVTLRLYDPLDSWGGPWGISAKEFVATLDDLPDDTNEIRLLINSPGGEVWEGLAILNALRSHKAHTVAVVEGIAASAASFVAAGADELVVMQNAEVFIHNAWGLCVGNAADMAKMQSELSHEDRNIASIYAAKAGGTADDWLAAMAEETWYSADEAVAAGLADRVQEPAKSDGGAAKAKAKFDLSIFDHHGRRKAQIAGAEPDSESTSATEAEVEKKGESQMASLTEGLVERLGIAEDADEDTILAAVDEALAERAADPAPAPAPVAAALPDGVVAIDRATLEALQASARRGDEARAEQEQGARVQAVETAIREGRIAPSQREAWVGNLQKDPSQAAVLASLAPVFPVGQEMGHAGTPDVETITDADMDAFAAQLGLPKGAFNE